MRRNALDFLHDFRNGKFLSLLVAVRTQREMNVIWHYNNRVQLTALAIASETGLHHDVPGSWWENPSSICAEADEERLAAGVVVGKVTAIVVTHLHSRVLAEIHCARSDHRTTTL